MSGFLFGLVIFLCVLALVLLLFPIKFRLEFDADERGGFAKLFLYRKILWIGEKYLKGKEPARDDVAGSEPPTSVPQDEVSGSDAAVAQRDEVAGSDAAVAQQDEVSGSDAAVAQQDEVSGFGKCAERTKPGSGEVAREVVVGDARVDKAHAHDAPAGDKPAGDAPADEEIDGEEGFMPTYVAAPPTPAVEKCEARKNAAEGLPAEDAAHSGEDREDVAPAIEGGQDVKEEGAKVENKAATASAQPAGDKTAEDVPAGDKTAEDVPASDKPAGNAPAGDKTAGNAPAGVETAGGSRAETAQPAGDVPADSKPEKRSLTDAEFWTIILTPDFDERAFRYVKNILGAAIRLIGIRFEGCFVEGIRGEYENMGYGAALNGIIKSYPFLKDWDLRMDWCHDRELRVHGNILARTDLCRILFFLLELALYAGIIALVFWKRRRHVLRTGELPELGFIRKKILDFIVEE